MKTQSIVALVSLLGSLSAYAQEESPYVAPETVTVPDDNYLSAAEADALFKNFGVKKIDANTFSLVGTIRNECLAKLEITASDSMGKDGFAGGWKIKDKGGALDCVKLHEKEACKPSTCKSLSDSTNAPKFTIIDINVEGLSKEQLKALPEQKIGLFRYDYAQDVSAPEYVQADALPGATFVSLAHLAVLEEIAAEERKEKMIKENEETIIDCLAKHEGYDDAKDAVHKLRQLGKLTTEQAKKELANLENEEFEGDLAKASSIHLTERKEYLKKLSYWANKRSKDADRIADARMIISDRIVSGTEKTEEDEAIGLVRKDFVEANDILASAGKAKGISREKSREISAKITKNNETRAYTLSGKGEMNNSDVLAAQRQYVAIENKVCSPQDKMQIAQLRMQIRQQQYGQQQQGYGMGSQFGMGLQTNFSLNTGFNGGGYNPYMQQQQQQNSPYNRQECFAAYQAEQGIAMLKQQSDQIRYQMAALKNGQQVNPNMTAGNFQQVRPNLYTTNPGLYPQQNTGMWNNNPTNVYNPMASYYSSPVYNPYGQYGI